MYDQVESHAVCIAEFFEQDKLKGHARKLADFEHNIAASHIYLRHAQWGEVVIFFRGCLVFWGVSQKDRKALLKDLLKYANDICQEQTVETYNVVPGHKVQIEDGSLIVDYGNIDSKIAISYGLAQAVKLKHYENIFSATMPDPLALPKDMAENGQVQISKKEALKKTGEILLVRSKINLCSDLLDTPEYFWERKEKEEQVYAIVNQEMELQTRIKKLNHRLDIMQSTYDLLRAYIEHKDSMKLEFAVVVLVFVEVVISLKHFVLELIS